MSRAPLQSPPEYSRLRTDPPETVDITEYAFEMNPPDNFSYGWTFQHFQQGFQQVTR